MYLCSPPPHLPIQDSIIDPQPLLGKQPSFFLLDSMKGHFITILSQVKGDPLRQMSYKWMITNTLRTEAHTSHCTTRVIPSVTPYTDINYSRRVICSESDQVIYLGLYMDDQNVSVTFTTTYRHLDYSSDAEKHESEMQPRCDATTTMIHRMYW